MKKEEVDEDKNKQYMAKRINNPDFHVFLDLKRKITDKLNDKFNPELNKILDIVLREIKEKFKDMSSIDMSSIDMSKEAFELFNNYVSKYNKEENNNYFESDELNLWIIEEFVDWLEKFVNKETILDLMQKNQTISITSENDEEMIKYVDTVDLKRKITDNLNDKFNPELNNIVNKIVDIIRREIEENFFDMSSIDISKEAFELFNNYVSKYNKEKNNDYFESDELDSYMIDEFVDWLEKFVNKETILDFKKKITKKLKKLDNDQVNNIVNIILKEIKEKFKDMSFVDMFEEAFELFNSYVLKFNPTWDNDIIFWYEYISIDDISLDDIKELAEYDKKIEDFVDWLKEQERIRVQKKFIERYNKKWCIK